MSAEPLTVVLRVAPKLAPLGKTAIRVLLGLNDVKRLLARVEQDIRASSDIPHGKHTMVWTRVESLRVDPVVAGCLHAYLTRGDMSAARVRLRGHLIDMLRLEDDAIDDVRVAELVVASIEQNLSRAGLKDRDAMRLEFALIRAAISDVADLVAATGVGEGQIVALEPALAPVGEQASPSRLLRARSGVAAVHRPDGAARGSLCVGAQRRRVLGRADRWARRKR